jgi:hypothetical protein
MFQLNGNPLSPDTAFTAGDIQYPANWLRLASPEERAAIGITEVADPVRADDRFYWNGDLAMPKDVDQIKAMLIAQVKQTAGSLLAPTDWMVIRKVERDVDIPASVSDYRAAVVNASGSNEAAIESSSTTAELAGLQLTWPENE